MDKTKGVIQVIILKPGITLENIDFVKIIRIKSDRYNVLIMRDHCPVIGEISHGTVAIEAEKRYEFKFAKGFFSFSHNALRLIISEEDDAGKI